MGNTRQWTSKLLKWLNRLSSPTPQPRCSCGRFCSTHEAPPDATAKLVSELSSQGLYVPAKFLSAQEGRGQQ